MDYYDQQLQQDVKDARYNDFSAKAQATQENMGVIYKQWLEADLGNHPIIKETPER